MAHGNPDGTHWDCTRNQIDTDTETLSDGYGSGLSLQADGAGTLHNFP